MKFPDIYRASLRVTALSLLLGLLGSSLALRVPAVKRADAAPSAGGGPSRGPVRFEPNQGQHDGRVRFVGRGGGQTIFLSAGEATFVLPVPLGTPPGEAPGAGPSQGPSGRAGLEGRRSYALKMRLLGADEGSTFAGEERLDGRLNYLKGNDPLRWATDVPLYGRVSYGEVYAGVGMTWYGAESGEVEYDFVVEPWADPSQIVLEFEGADRLATDAAGDLVIETAAGTLRHRRPLVYQEEEGRGRRTVEGGYVLRGNRVSFGLGEYDRTRRLVIDPVIPGPHITWSTYLGGGADDLVGSIKVDAAGGVYVAGATYSPDYPVTSGVQSTDYDCFVTKLNPAGTALVYSTLLGGTGGPFDDKCTSMDIDDSGNVYVTGATGSTDFPTALFGYDKTYNGGEYDAFAAKLNSNGSALAYSTYLGGSGDDTGYSVAVDGSGNAYVTGSTSSPNYKVTSGAFDTTHGGDADAFVTKLNSLGTSLVYSTYLGGAKSEVGYGLAVDGLGRTFVTGKTLSDDFPTTLFAYDKTHGVNNADAFVAKLNSAGSGLVYSTYLGGGGADEGRSVAADDAGYAYVTGSTSSTDFPVTRGAPLTAAPASDNAFVTRLNTGGSGLTYSTYLGGSNQDSGGSLVVDGAGDLYVTGSTSSPDFPTNFAAYDDTHNGGSDVFLVKLTPSALAGLSASTFIGGSLTDAGNALAVNSLGDAYIAGRTHSSNYPTPFTPFDQTHNGGFDVFVTRYNNYWLP